MEEVASRGTAVARKMVDRSRFAHIALREILFLFFSLAGAIAFLNHQVLYFAGDGPSSLSWLAYAVSTVLIYGFVRGVSVAGSMRVPPRTNDPGICPECGRPFEDGTPVGARWLPRPAREPSGSASSRGLTVPLAQPVPSRTATGEVVNPRLDFLLWRGLPTQNPPAPQVRDGLAPRSKETQRGEPAKRP